MTFLTNEIQALQHQWKKYMDIKGDCIDKWTSFGHLPREYLGQPMNFSVDFHTSIMSFCYYPTKESSFKNDVSKI